MCPVKRIQFPVSCADRHDHVTKVLAKEMEADCGIYGR